VVYGIFNFRRYSGNSEILRLFGELDLIRYKFRCEGFSRGFEGDLRVFIGF